MFDSIPSHSDLIHCNNLRRRPVEIRDGRLKLLVLVDRSMVEVYVDGGRSRQNAGLGCRING